MEILNDTSVNHHRTKIGMVISELRKTQEEFLLFFVKKNGKKRLIRCKFGVRHNLKGGVNHTQQNRFPYQTVWDLDKKAYRTINMDTATNLIRGGGDESIFQS